MANNLERLENCQKRLENCQKMLDDLVENMKDYHEDLNDWIMALDKHAQEFKEELNKTPADPKPKNEPATKPPPSPQNSI